MTDNLFASLIEARRGIAHTMCARRLRDAHQAVGGDGSLRLSRRRLPQLPALRTAAYAQAAGSPTALREAFRSGLPHRVLHAASAVDPRCR